MSHKTALHPTPETLAAFVHGQLGDEALMRVEEHVMTCESCVDFLRTVPEDNLLKQIRQADTSTLGGATRVEPAGDDDDAQKTGVESFSPGRFVELANHPRYRIIKQLGAGGMGIVYQAEHRLMERTVAIKVITPDLVSNPNAVERFHQEVKAAARLTHKNIVTAYDAEQSGSLHYLVMEYVAGSSLDSVVAKNGPLSVQRACYYAMQAAAGLEHARQNGMVHRDIKPQNLMCTPEGIVKILDFGLARLAVRDEDETQTGLTAFGMTVGTPDYIAPEQARDSRSVDIRADIYSLGCTLYFLLSGTTPFPEGTALEKVVAHMERQPPPVSERRPGVPGDVERVLERMLEKDPDQRFQTPKDVIDALKPILHATSKTQATIVQPRPGDVPIVRDDPSERSRPKSKTKRSWIPAAAALVAALTIVLAVIYLRSKTNQDGIAERDQAEVWVDLLAAFDPGNVIAGDWQKVGDTLVVDDQTNARLLLPATVPPEYDLEIEITRRSGVFSVGMIFPAGEGAGSFEMDAWGKGLTGIQGIGGRTLEDDPAATFRPAEEGDRHTMLLQVRRGKVTAFVDGKEVDSYRGDGGDLEIVEPWDWQHPGTLGVAAYESSFTFHKIRYRPVLE